VLTIFLLELKRWEKYVDPLLIYEILQFLMIKHFQDLLQSIWIAIAIGI